MRERGWKRIASWWKKKKCTHNPYPFRALNDDGEDILVCMKCGKNYTESNQ